jgi:hypothetical protein
MSIAGIEFLINLIHDSDVVPVERRRHPRAEIQEAQRSLDCRVRRK